jgi:hypothetical protein
MHLRAILCGLLVASTLSLTAAVRADGPGDNLVDNVRRIPPPGVPVPAADRLELEAGIAQLGQEIQELRSVLKNKPVFLDLLPDVQIYYNAARYALQYDEFFNAREINVAKELLAQGMKRAQELRVSQAPWAIQTGLVVRGYVSKIDGSVQPYGLVVPVTYATPGASKFRLDFWFHGRGEVLSEVNFINDRQRNVGEFSPPNTFVLHPYGRYCNANKLAGEIDTLEALEHARKHYPIDDNRVSVRGFSMGGAACWQFAVHYASDWAAAAPGAGFSETADFLKVFQNEKVKPTWYEQKLWHMYDCTDYAMNLFNLPTVAYSGEVDGQKQAADMMAAALVKEGITLVHIIGPKAGHFYEAGAKREVSRRVDSIMAAGRNPVPEQIQFTTWTLRYNKMFWITLDGLEQHWERARVNATLTPAADRLTLDTKNVSALTLSFPPGLCPLPINASPMVTLDGQRITAPKPGSDRSWTAHFRKNGVRWTVVDSLDDGKLRKRPGLQGPIDDAFMDSFIMVRPTGTPMNEKTGAWVAKEQAHAIEHWRRQFRGEARVADDTALLDEEIASSNLVLWGDPSSNKVLARIADKLPVKWDAQGVHVGTKTYAGDHHVPVLVYPNPLNPKHYVVLNSGFTYREYDYLNNARQVPKLPDWAIVDINTPVNSRYPGAIPDAGFFGEEWELKAAAK